MSKPVFITSDSTCDLTPELLERFNVKTAPFTSYWERTPIWMV